MPAWIVIFVVVVGVIAVAISRAPAGNRFAVVAMLAAGALGLLVLIFFLRSRSAYNVPAARVAPVARGIARQETRQVGASVAAPMRELHAIPESALAPEPAPRATEPDDPPAPTAATVANDAPPAPLTLPDNDLRYRNVPPIAADGAAARPAWITTTEGWQPDGNYYAVITATGRTLDECWNMLFAHQIPMTIHLYAMREIGGAWPYPNEDRDLAKQLVIDQYIEPWRGGGVNIDGSYNMHQLFVRLHFKPEVRERLIANRVEVLRTSRVAYTAWFGLMACGALGVVFGYLKLDSLWEGANTRGLRIVAIALLVGVAFCTCLVLAYFVQVESYGGILA